MTGLRGIPGCLHSSLGSTTVSRQPSIPQMTKGVLRRTPSHHCRSRSEVLCGAQSGKFSCLTPVGLERKIAFSTEKVDDFLLGSPGVRPEVGVFPTMCRGPPSTGRGMWAHEHGQLLRPRIVVLILFSCSRYRTYNREVPTCFPREFVSPTPVKGVELKD